MGEPRAFIAGTRIRVQDVVQDYERRGLTAEEIAGEYTNEQCNSADADGDSVSS